MLTPIGGEPPTPAPVLRAHRDPELVACGPRRHGSTPPDRRDHGGRYADNPSLGQGRVLAAVQIAVETSHIATKRDSSPHVPRPRPSGMTCTKVSFAALPMAAELPARTTGAPPAPHSDRQRNARCTTIARDLPLGAARRWRDGRRDPAQAWSHNLDPAPMSLQSFRPSTSTSVVLTPDRQYRRRNAFGPRRTFNVSPSAMRRNLHHLGRSPRAEKSGPRARRHYARGEETGQSDNLEFGKE